MESAMYNTFFARPAAYSPLADGGSPCTSEPPKTPDAHCDGTGSPSHESRLLEKSSTKAQDKDQQDGNEPKSNKKKDWMMNAHFQLFIVFGP